MLSLQQQKSTQVCRWHPLDAQVELTQTVSRIILMAAQTAIQQRGAFHLVLAGGTTPRQIYESLRNSKADWQQWHLYFGDERCLPPEHIERNSTMAQSSWLNFVPIPKQNIHIIPAELGAAQAALRYADCVKEGVQFDLVLLGLGEDGHTASLFPGHDWGVTSQAAAALPVFDAPKPPPERVSLSARRLSAANAVIYVVTGSGKLNAVNAWREGLSIPAASVTPACGVDIYLEQSLIPSKPVCKKPGEIIE